MKEIFDGIDVMIGARIRARREQLQLTQAELGAKIGVSFQQIQKYEKGANRVAGRRIIDLASSLKVPNTFFFEGIAELSAGSASTDDSCHLKALSQQDRYGRQLLRVFASLEDPSDRARVLAVVESLVDVLLRKPRDP